MSSDHPSHAVPIRQTRLLIDGQWVEAASGKTFETLNPATGQVIARVAEADVEDVNRAVSAARRAFDTGPWRRMSGRERGKLLYRLADLMEQNMGELAALETLDNGKPLNDSLNGDLPLSIDCYRYYAGWADKLEGKTIPVQGPFHVYPARTGRRGRSGHSLELPAPDAGLEMGSGPGDRLHPGSQARRTNPPDRTAGGRTGHGSRFS